MTEYITKDSGEREEYDSGMKRDTEAGKPRFDLMIPEGVPYEEQLLTRFALLLSRGAEKYDARNWEKGDSKTEIDRAMSSAFRHFMQWYCGERDEDHAVAVMFNLMVVETIERKIRLAREDALAKFTQSELVGGGEEHKPVINNITNIIQRQPQPITVEDITVAMNRSFNRGPEGPHDPVFNPGGYIDTRRRLGI